MDDCGLADEREARNHRLLPVMAFGSRKIHALFVKDAFYLHLLSIMLPPALCDLIHHAHPDAA
jgi:hypothetical protein